MPRSGFLLVTLIAAAMLVACSPAVPAGGVPPAGTATRVGLNASPTDTRERVGLVRRYLALVSERRYDEAWELLSAARRRGESAPRLADRWRARGAVQLDRGDGAAIWLADELEVRSRFWVDQSRGAGGIEQWSFTLIEEDGIWRIDAEGRWGLGELSPAPTPQDLARAYITALYGPLWAATLVQLSEDPYTDGHVLVFRLLDPTIGEVPQSVAMPIVALSAAGRGGWTLSGGGGLGSVAPVGRYAASCARTWLSPPGFEARGGTALPSAVAATPAATGEPGPRGVAAFFCTVEDPRVATVEVVLPGGAVERRPAAGRQAVVFPFQDRAGAAVPCPQAIRLFDVSGEILPLPTSPEIAEGGSACR